MEKLIHEAKRLGVVEACINKRLGKNMLWRYKLGTLELSKKGIQQSGYTQDELVARLVNFLSREQVKS